jgi:hypothetical protein
MTGTVEEWATALRLAVQMVPETSNTFEGRLIEVAVNMLSEQANKGTIKHVTQHLADQAIVEAAEQIKGQFPGQSVAILPLNERKLLVRQVLDVYEGQREERSDTTVQRPQWAARPDVVPPAPPAGSKGPSPALQKTPRIPIPGMSRASTS